MVQGSAVSGYQGFPAKCPGTRGTGFKSCPGPVLAHRRRGSQFTRHPPCTLPPGLLFPSGFQHFSLALYIHSQKALCAQLESTCTTPLPPVYREGSPIFPRGSSPFLLSVLAVGLTLPHPQVAVYSVPGQREGHTLLVP